MRHSPSLSSDAPTDEKRFGLMVESNAKNEAGCQPVPVGVLGQFDTPDALKRAAAGLRDAGFRNWDVHSPYPIHGLDRAMGIRPTRLPWIVLGAGLTGIAIALALQIWTNAIDYPINISGKPLMSIPAFIPITFELMVLLAAFAAFGGALVLNLLPQYGHPIFQSRRFVEAAGNGFFITIESRDPKFHVEDSASLLRSLGAAHTELLLDLPGREPYPSWLKIGVLTACILAVLPPLLVTAYRASPKSEPRIHIIQDMDFQEKYKAQTVSTLFADGRSARPDVEGVVAVGTAEEDEHLYRGLIDGKPAETFPMPITMLEMQRGRELFNVYCAPCHGRVGEGGVTGIVSARAVKRQESTWTMPLSLHADSVIDQPVGQLFETITVGRRSMPGYSAQIPAADRWAIVAYIRALQRSRHATIDDVPEEIRANLK